MVEVLRTYSQQLANHKFNTAHELVSYMGAVQAQDVVMSKWALGIRLQQPSLSEVEQALDSGRIVRTHVLRPTWHMVSAEDIRWMIDLSGQRIRKAYISWGKEFDINEKSYKLFCDAVIRMLTGSDGLTKLEIADNLKQIGINMPVGQVNCMLCICEADGLLCNGKEKKKKNTYALLEERVPPAKSISKEEALALLATKYFRSHCPASLEDFEWWSGLTATDAKKAVQSIQNELITDRYKDENLYIHECYADDYSLDKDVHLLPPYDEYLISYKNRTHALSLEHNRKAFTPYGIFFPVVYYQGKIVGNWKKITKKGQTEIETTLFDKKTKLNSGKLKTATDRYISFLKK